MPGSLMTPEQVAEARSRYEAGWSLRRLADDGWERWGYVSSESARAALRLAFSRAGFKLRTVQDAMRLLYAPIFQDRFWSKVEKHDVDCSCCNGCWHWRAARLRWGHGQFSVDGPCFHPGPPVIVVRGSIGRRVFDPRRKATAPTLEEAREIMGLPNGTAAECADAIPPAYTELIGHQLLRHVLLSDQEQAV